MNRIQNDNTIILACCSVLKSYNYIRPPPGILAAATGAAQGRPPGGGVRPEAPAPRRRPLQRPPVLPPPRRSGHRCLRSSAGRRIQRQSQERDC